MDNTALQLNNFPANIEYHPPVKYANLNRSGRPKGAKNLRTKLIEANVPDVVKALESVPKDIRDKMKDALSWKALNVMGECLEIVDHKTKPDVKFSMASKLYDLTTPRVQNIQVDSRQTVIRSQDLLEGLKLLKRQGNDTIEGQE